MILLFDVVTKLYYVISVSLLEVIFMRKRLCCLVFFVNIFIGCTLGYGTSSNLADRLMPLTPQQHEAMGRITVRLQRLNTSTSHDFLCSSTSTQLRNLLEICRQSYTEINGVKTGILAVAKTYPVGTQFQITARRGGELMGHPVVATLEEDGSLQF
jgi:hypothetical protein